MSPRKINHELLIQQFSKLFTKFSLYECKEHVLPFFEEITWTAVEKAVKKYNLSKKMSDIAKIFVEYTKDHSFEELLSLYHNILLTETILHNTRKNWTAVVMKKGQSIPIDDNCVTSISKQFRKESQNIRLTATLEDDILWLSLVAIHRTKSNRAIYKKPIFIARTCNRPYIFFNPKQKNDNILKILVSGFGFKNYKICKLDGKNIPSLITLLNKRKYAEKHRTETALVLKNTVADCVRSTTGLDFCQEKMRSIHANQILGEEPITLEKLVVKAHTEFRGLRTMPELEDTQVEVTMQIRSKNCRNVIEIMIRNGIIKPPYPEWVKEFLISGKNLIDIAEN